MNARGLTTMIIGCRQHHTGQVRTLRLLRLLAFCVPLAIAATVAVTSVPAPASAQEQQRVPVDQATTKQKAIFVERLVTKSISAQTIESSGDADAIAALGKARALVAEAKSDLGTGRFEVANGKLDQAIALVNAEARRLSESEVQKDRQQDAYEKRLHTVTTFLKAYERVASEQGMSAASTQRIDEIRHLATEAETLARDGRVEEATALLDRAYIAARGDIREMREGKTLTRSLNFATAKEEYDYERDRNESHLMLLRFATVEKQPPETRLKRIEELREKATDLRSRAERQAASGDHKEAIDTLIESTGTLLQAIRMTGLYVPG